MKSSPPVPVIL